MKTVKIRNFHHFSTDHLLRSSRFHWEPSQYDIILLFLWYRMLVFKSNLKQQCQFSIFFIVMKSYWKKKEPVKHKIHSQRKWEEDIWTAWSQMTPFFEKRWQWWHNIISDTKMELDKNPVRQTLLQNHSKFFMKWSLNSFPS